MRAVVLPAVLLITACEGPNPSIALRATVSLVGDDPVMATASFQLYAHACTGGIEENNVECDPIRGLTASSGGVAFAEGDPGMYDANVAGYKPEYELVLDWDGDTQHHALPSSPYFTAQVTKLATEEFHVAWTPSDPLRDPCMMIEMLNGSGDSLGFADIDCSDAADIRVYVGTVSLRLAADNYWIAQEDGPEPYIDGHIVLSRVLALP